MPKTGRTTEPDQVQQAGTRLRRRYCPSYAMRVPRHAQIQAPLPAREHVVLTDTVKILEPRRRGGRILLRGLGLRVRIIDHIG